MFDVDRPKENNIQLSNQAIEWQTLCKKEFWPPTYCPEGFEYSLNSLATVSGTISK